MDFDDRTSLDEGLRSDAMRAASRNLREIARAGNLPRRRGRGGPLRRCGIGKRLTDTATKRRPSDPTAAGKSLVSEEPAEHTVRKLAERRTATAQQEASTEP